MKKHRKLVVVLGSIVLLSAFLVSCGNSEPPSKGEKQQVTPSPTTSEPQQQQEQSTPRFYKVGEVVDIGGHTLLITITRTWQVNKAQANELAWTDDMGPDDYYLIVDLTVKNVSQTPLSISAYSFVMRDSEGNKMEMYPFYVAKNVGAQPSGNILPGMQQKGSLTFWAKHSIKTYDLMYQPDMPETPPILWKIS